MLLFWLGLGTGVVGSFVLSYVTNELFIRSGRGPLTLTMSGETRENVRKLQELTEADTRHVTAKALAVYDLLMRHDAEGWEAFVERGGGAERKRVVLK